MNKPSALISASAMHLLLAQNPDFDDLPVEWTIDLDRVMASSPSATPTATAPPG